MPFVFLPEKSSPSQIQPLLVLPLGALETDEKKILAPCLVNHPHLHFNGGLIQLRGDLKQFGDIF